MTDWPYDAGIPALGEVLDAGRMAARIADHLHATGAPASVGVSRCVLEKTYYRPGRHLGVLYRTAFDAPGSPPFEQWIYLRAFTPEIGRQRYDNAIGSVNGVRPHPAPLASVPPLAFWDDLLVSVALFPYDRKLPHLARAADPERIAGELERRFGAGTWRSPVMLEPIKYMPGKRCVLKLRAGAPQGKPALSFYAKTYPAGESGRHYQAWRSVRAQLDAQGSRFDLPRPLGHLEDLHTVWVEDWGGSPLLDSLGDPSWEAKVRLAAEAVAALHRSRIDGLPPAPSEGDILEVSAADLAREGAGVPEHPRLAAAIRARLEAARPATAGGAPRVPVHGACRAEQMLARADCATLVDFDAMACGDPLADVAEWIASIEFLAITGGLDPEPLRSAALFLESYSALTPWPLDSRRLAWHVLAFLASKMCSVRQHLNVAAVERLRAHGEAWVERWMEVLA